MGYQNNENHLKICCVASASASISADFSGYQ
jgi:hypothetical protein